MLFEDFKDFVALKMFASLNEVIIAINLQRQDLTREKIASLINHLQKVKKTIKMVF